MKTTSIKNIHLKEYELKQAIIEYVAKTEPELAQHLYDNSCSMSWSGKALDTFVISIDGEIEDLSVDINQAADKVIEQHSKAFEKLAKKEE